jgi:imidazolonepropionase
LVAVGPTRRVENLAAAREAIEISARGRVVMPGFVDCHTHLLFPSPGTRDGDLDVQARTLHTTTAMQLKMRARVCLQAMARHGTTTVEVKTGTGFDAGAEMKILRTLAELKDEPLDIIPSFLFRRPPSASDADANFAAIWHSVCHDFLPSIRRRRLAEFADLVWDGLFFHEEVYVGYLQVARSLGLGCKLHADYRDISAAVLAAVAQRVTSIDHLEHATATDAALLSRSDTVAALLPSGAFYGGAEYAPARLLIEAGVPVALATNFNGQHTPALSMQTAVSLACRQMGLSAAEAISAATINSAYALDCGERIGSLEHGKFADLLLLSVSDYRDLAHALGTNLVHIVIKSGEVIYEEGQVGVRPPEDLQPSW